MIVALTREPARAMSGCELTYLERQGIDAALAAEQHRAYRETLASCGARVVALPAIEELPDSVFVEDTAIVLDELVVLTSPGNESRRGEVGLIEPEVARLRTVERVSLPATIEGGDVLRAGRRLFVGLSPRTNHAGAEALRRLASPFGYEVRAVEVRDCLHLKTGCSALDDETILVNPDWVDTDAFRDYEVVRVHAAEPWAANALRVGASVCVSAAHPRTAELIGRRGYAVRPLDISEFAKAEGGLTCLSLIFKQ
ncbi:MAG TPA: arginine deiminase family protein [Pyrinomonadaceae bacterium]